MREPRDRREGGLGRARRPGPPGAPSRAARLRAFRTGEGRLLAAAARRSGGPGDPRIAPACRRRRGDGGHRGRNRAALHAPLAPELLDRPGALPARLLHDEAQPPHQRGSGAAAGLRGVAPAGARGGQPGDARARVAARADPDRADRPRARHAAALGRRPGGARRHPHDPGGAREIGQPAADGPDPRLRARHQPRLGALRRLPGPGAQVQRPGHARSATCSRRR